MREQGYYTRTTKSANTTCNSKIAIVAENRLVDMLGDKMGSLIRLHHDWQTHLNELQE